MSCGCKSFLHCESFRIYATIPFANIASATELRIIKERSFHITATHNQPVTPRNCRNMLYGYRSLVVNIIADIRIRELAHLTYHIRG
jgi:hypothetical protein|tara:strand:- start:112 stop:372 length:261 start_codon:yes stop_codon:yes gene_type:complete